MKIPRSCLFLSGLMLLGLLGTPPAFADRSDWVQVERFEKQLAQARQGSRSAMYEVGRMYEYGRGTDYDLAKAAEWYRKAADAGSAPAMARLGVLYLEGRGVAQNHKKAYRLFAEAANENVPLAQYNLGLMYEWGTVVRQDRNKAIFWYQKALAGGDYRAEDKIRQLKAQAKTTTRQTEANTPKPKPAAKPAPVPASKPARGNRSIIRLLSAKWMQGNHPAGYLPSTISQCKKVSSQQIDCVARNQQRNTDAEIIVFDTEAHLSNFKGNRFTITYTNTVVEVKPRQATAGPLGEGDTAPVTSNIKAGQKSRPHKLECQLLDKSNVRCTRDNIRTYDFTS